MIGNLSSVYKFARFINLSFNKCHIHMTFVKYRLQYELLLKRLSNNVALGFVITFGHPELSHNLIHMMST